MKTVDPELPLREFDLPPMWDGVPIVWSDQWRDSGYAIFICPPPKPQVCPRCRTTDRPLFKVGRSAAPEGIVNLSVWRCVWCQLDTVLDQITGETWTLDLTDYGPTGSVRPTN